MPWAVVSILESSVTVTNTTTWQHLVIAVDTTQATAANRVKMYHNGTEVTNFAVDNRSNYTLNFQTSINNTLSHRIGLNNSSHYFRGRLSDLYLIDGAALDASAFGENSGGWKPKRYMGAYGTNGFHMFGEGMTSGNIGTDRSGNGNNFSPSNMDSSNFDTDGPI